MVEYSPYALMVLLMTGAALFALAPLGIAWLWARKFSPAKPGSSKNAIYECGLESKGDAWIQFKSEYYLYGIVFLVFDVESIFLLPFAAAFTKLPAGAFVAMLVFLLLLVEGLVWAWRKGVLDWDQSRLPVPVDGAQSPAVRSFARGSGHESAMTPT
jgi:NADH:ubiquinone oxidoreductase subunit 3 (subunit A)